MRGFINLVAIIIVVVVGINILSSSGSFWTALIAAGVLFGVFLMTRFIR